MTVRKQNLCTGLAHALLRTVAGGHAHQAQAFNDLLASAPTKQQYATPAWGTQQAASS